MKDFIYDCKCQNNDKKQIEEMYQEFLQYKHDTMCEVFSYKGMCENFINLGYRKINENEIVIGKKEYENLKSELAPLISHNADGGASCHLCLQANEAKVSKETAEKILSLIVPDCKSCDENWHNGCLCLRASISEKIAKEFGVDLGEEK